MASPFPVGRAPPLPRQLKGGSKRARILCRRQPQCPHPAALRFCRAFRGGFAAAPPSTRLPRRLSILSIQPPRRLALLPARWACAFAAGKRLPTFRGGGFASSALSVHLPRRLGILSIQPPRRLALLPARWACAFAAIKRPPAFSRRRLRGFRAFPFRRASLLPLSLSPRLLALRSPAVFPASKSRKNSGRGIDRARWRASVTDSIWLSIPRPAASKAVRGGAYRPARRRP